MEGGQVSCSRIWPPGPKIASLAGEGRTCSAADEMTSDKVLCRPKEMVPPAQGVSFPILRTLGCAWRTLEGHKQTRFHPVVLRVSREIQLEQRSFRDELFDPAELIEGARELPPLLRVGGQRTIATWLAGPSTCISFGMQSAASVAALAVVNISRLSMSSASSTSCYSDMIDCACLI
jgi:hypothetical protein